MFCSVKPTSETNRNVSIPMKATIVPRSDPAMAGERRSSRKTPALTIVLEWRSAEVGEGAYMAPSSQDENGIWALLVIPAKARSATARRTRPLTGPAVSLSSSRLAF